MTLGASILKAHFILQLMCFKVKRSTECAAFSSYPLSLWNRSSSLDFQDLDTSCRLQDSYFGSVWETSLMIKFSLLHRWQE